MIYIIPTGGLCNYLRVVFSYNAYAKSVRKKLTVIWLISHACNGFFLDYFEKVPNIHFVKKIPPWVKIKYKGCSPCSKTAYTFDELIPLPNIKQTINTKLHCLQHNYIAIHVRRTDHIRYLSHKKQTMTSDETFMEFINNNSKDCNLYIATDNAETFNTYKSKYNDIVKTQSSIYNPNYLRQTPLEDAIVDLFMCVLANKFKGSNRSSFSDQIDTMRKEKNRAKLFV